MKKLITILTGLCLIVFFLIYSGFFRDNKDPVAVAEYFLQCMEEGEWALTFQVTKFEYFEAGHNIRGLVCKWFRGKKINNIKFELLAGEGDHARVRAEIAYKGGNVVENITTLERNYHGNWVVSGTKFHPVRQ